MLASLLKYVGFGMVATGIQDGGLDDNPNSAYYNSAIAVVGFVGWAVGSYLESREANAPRFWPANSTDLIRRTLNYAAGAGAVCGLTHLIKQVGSTSAAIGTFSAGIILPVAAEELKVAANRLTPKMKWEKLRFAILTAGDFLFASSMKKVVNGEHLDILSIVALPLGFALAIGEGVYTYKNDIKPLVVNALNQYDQSRLSADVLRVLNKRLMKLTVGLGTLFILQDIIQGNTDKYSIANDIYVILTNIFLFAALLEMRKLAIAQIADENSLQPALEMDHALDPQYRVLSGADEFRLEDPMLNDIAMDYMMDIHSVQLPNSTPSDDPEVQRRYSR
jgi:hypothetical protein